MRKKLTASVMALVLAAALAAGCGASDSAAGNQEQAQEENAAAEGEESAEAAQEGEGAAEGETAETPEAEAELPDDAFLSGIKAADYVEVAPDYASLTVEVASPAEVTDEEVNNAITDMLNAHQELREIEGRTTVQEGDVVNIDYTGYLNDKPFDGGNAQGFNLQIGSRQFVPGFEDGLIGAEVGEEVELTITFPENYNAENLAGQETVFKVNVNAIQEYVVPDFTDEFVAGLGITDDFGNVISTTADYRTYEKNQIVKERDYTYSTAVKNAILDQLVTKSTYAETLPEAMVDRFYNQMLDEYTYKASYYQMDLPTLMAMVGYSENYEEELRKDAGMTVQSYLALQAVGEKEGLLLSDEDFAVELEKYVEKNAAFSTVDDMGRDMQESYREYLNANAVLDFLVSKTTVTEPAAEEETAAQETETK